MRRNVRSKEGLEIESVWISVIGSHEAKKKIGKKKQKVKQDKQHRHNSEGGTVYVAIYCN